MNKKDGEFMKFDGKYDKVIQEIAEEEGITVQDVRIYMQEAIEKAYSANNPSFMKMFGYKKPTIEEFIEIVTMNLQKSRS